MKNTLLVLQLWRFYSMPFDFSTAALKKTAAPEHRGTAELG